jgi:hypothetical protein
MGKLGNMSAKRVPIVDLGAIFLFGGSKSRPYRPNGATDCSRGWSSARCKRAERNPWKRRVIDTPAPRGAEEVTSRGTDQ